jgi:hypothetical protein
VPKYRVYVIGSPTYVTIEHSAASAEELLGQASQSGFIAGQALERNGRRRNVVVPYRNVTLIADGEDQGIRMRTSSTTTSRKLS